MLILNANRRAAKFIGDAHRSNVHFALLQGLRFGQLRLLMRPPIEGHALLDQPRQNRARLFIRDAQHGRIKGGLAQALFENPRRMQQLIGDDGVEHPHAAFVEHAHDRLAFSKAPGEIGERPAFSSRETITDRASRT